MGLSIRFTNPWLLFLLIPAAALVLIPYFTLSKKYRRTRNRVVSLVLESVILVITVFLLSGMLFITREANTQNEIILLVDVSDTQKESEEERDDFVNRVINSASYEGYRLGIVTFGFTQEYAVPLTDNASNMFEDYLAADKPDTSATDIAAALNYTKDLFGSDAAKIVLVTDGKETDESAKNVIKSISAQGISVDIAHVSSAYKDNEVQLLDVELPDYHLNVNEECTLSVNVLNSVEGDGKKYSPQSVKIELYDNGESIESETQVIELPEGTKKIDFKHTFKEGGLHEILFRLTYEGSGDIDTIEMNNEYSKYMYLEVFNKVLVIESKSGQSEMLKTLLGDKGYEITTVNVADAQNMPATVDDLRQYDQVVLNNIAYSDFETDNPEYTAQNGKPQYIYPFVDMLYTYVNDYGGGLLTTGGTEEGQNSAHAYNRDDLINTPLQKMLPVQAVNYTPPLGLVIIIDRSGSMDDEWNGKTCLEWARSGAQTCLENMTERDYIGLLTLDADFNMVLPMTPVTQKTKVESAISSIKEANGGTSYSAAIERAGQMLKAMDNVQKKHIILMSDGMVSDSEYMKRIDNFYRTDRITFSVVGIGISPFSQEAEKMKAAAELGHGRVIAVSNPQDGNFIGKIREELNTPEIKALNQGKEPFAPLAKDALSPVMKGIERKVETRIDKDENGKDKVVQITTNFLTVELQGFYGVKAKTGANVVLATEYGAPLYAHWNLGKGKVGSFMCDVYGKWSAEFLNDTNGKQFISNAVFNLMPLESVRPTDITAEIKGENYLNQLSVYTNLQEGEYVRGEIEYTVDGETQKVDMNAVTENTDGLGCYVTGALAASNNFSRSTFVLKQGGVYKITLTKYNSSNEALSSYELYKDFSYSKEYDINLEADEEVLKRKLSDLAKNGDGALIQDLQAPWEIFENFVTVFEYVFDPRILFAVIIMVLFLLDVAVRKFKFKWIHEIVRERKERKANRKDS